MYLLKAMLTLLVLYLVQKCKCSLADHEVEIPLLSNMGAHLKAELDILSSNEIEKIIKLKGFVNPRQSLTS